MRYHQTSVLIANTKGKSNKVRRIPTHIVVHWRKYAVFLCLLVVLLVVVSGLMIHQNTSRIYKEKLVRANYIKSRIDLEKVKSAFQSIDSSMYRINSFLQERGLEELRMKNAGGENNFEITEINEIADYYDKKVNALKTKLESVPIGKPCGGEISSNFGYRCNPFTGRGAEFHSGIDFKGQRGDTIRTTGKGIILFAGYKGGYGRCVIVRHEEDMQTLYGHLSHIEVKEGQKVETGQMIGRLGNTGRSTGPHLHYEIIRIDEKVNPIEYVIFNSKENDREKQ